MAAVSRIAALAAAGVLILVLGAELASAGSEVALPGSAGAELQGPGRTLLGYKYCWEPCAKGRAKNYLRCCRKRECYGQYDPSCPRKGKSCGYLPSRYFWQCCRGKAYYDVYDPACDDSNPWDPWGQSCRYKRDVDKCCAKKNPWTDRKACWAWTDGSCRKVSRRWRKACCAGKWYGEDRYCDQQTIYGWSCASWGPDGVDACCACKDPWTDQTACRNWLPWGDCSRVKTQYRPACCDNKPWGAPGCPGSTPPGSSCASRPPQFRDQCCYDLFDVRSDPSGCRDWQPGSSGCQYVAGKYQYACCAGKRWGDDPWCDYGSCGSPSGGCSSYGTTFQSSPAAIAATADPIADQTATVAEGGSTKVAPASVVPTAAGGGACDKPDRECVNEFAYCENLLVVACPPGLGCNSTAGKFGDTCTTSAAPSVDEVKEAEAKAEPACEGNNTCIDGATYCLAGEVLSCAQDYICQGTQGASTPCVLDPAKKPECTQADNTCLDDKTGLCVAGKIVSCADGFGCEGDAGAASCEATKTPPPPDTPAIESCTAPDMTCLSDTTVCMGKQVTPCPSGYVCNTAPSSDGSDVCTPSATAPVDCAAGMLLCVDSSTLCDGGAKTACAAGEVCVAQNGAAACQAPPSPDAGPAAVDEDCMPNSCIDASTLCDGDGKVQACASGEACDDSNPDAAACAVPPPPSPPSPPEEPEAPAPESSDSGAGPDPGTDSNTDSGETASPSPEQAASPAPAPPSPSEEPASPSPSPSPASSPSPAPEEGSGAVVAGESPSPEEPAPSPPSPEEPAPSPPSPEEPAPSPPSPEEPAPSPPSPEEPAPSPPSPEEPAPEESPSPSPPSPSPEEAPASPPPPPPPECTEEQTCIKPEPKEDEDPALLISKQICTDGKKVDCKDGEVCLGDAGKAECKKEEAPAANTDAGTSDAGTSDAGSSDAGTSDAGTSDAGTSDAGNSDSGNFDSGSEGNFDAGAEGEPQE